MLPHVIEGTWEEIKRHEAELVGRHVRLTVTPEKPVDRKPNTHSKESAKAAGPKELRAFGMLAGRISTEEYLREKREDTLREDRSLR